MIEELLRWETPVMGCARVATRDIEIGDFAVSKGEQVMALLGAANVDDAEFSDSESLVLGPRYESTPCFWGWDPPMSRITPCSTRVRLALQEWHRRIPEYRLKPGVELNYTAGIRTIDTFPMILGTAG